MTSEERSRSKHLSRVTVELLPLGKKLEVKRGTPLQDILFAEGVEFPCGGRGLCKGCRVKVLDGPLRVTLEDRQKLTPAELEQGWRLSCRATAERDLKLELAQWEATILSDESVFEFTPKEGLGIAVDVGTTTVVAQLLDLKTGHVLGVAAELNEQAQHGADIMSRIEFACMKDGQARLQGLIREQIGRMARQLLSSSGAAYIALNKVVLVGNTVMHHLFCGVSVEPLSHYPFEPEAPGLQAFRALELGWGGMGSTSVTFLPCIGGFVGSDILAGILATGLHEAGALVTLLDLGTNGEIVVGTRERLLCASTAAGPAFEGARISMGMRAATGAISEVTIKDGKLHCHVLGQRRPRGICGSGLVDAVAAGLQLGWVRSTGRLVNGEKLPLLNPVSLNQRDIRELQLAKGAIAAGLRILLVEFGAEKEQLSAVYLAGAFGNYINHASARRIGLLDVPAAVVKPAGNTALLGAKMALFSSEPLEEFSSRVLRRTQHVSLKEDAAFQDTFVEEMSFPQTEAMQMA